MYRAMGQRYSDGLSSPKFSNVSPYPWFDLHKTYAYSLISIYLSQLKILQSGWLRDGTWPEGAVAPSWDDQLPLPPDSQHSPYNPHPTQQQQQQQEQYQNPAQANRDDFLTRIPPGYTQSSGDQSGEAEAERHLGYQRMQQYQQPYPYSQPTPPPPASAVDPLRPSPPPSSSSPPSSTRSQPGGVLGFAGREDDDDDDDDEEEDEEADADAEELRRRHPSDSRHEGG